jgi:putative effector of murein hydrolase LrgA (UPF0299 family)
MWSLLISLAVIFVFWLAGQALGFSISLAGSIVLSILLTLIVNLIAGAIHHRRDVRRFEGA